MAQFPNVGTVFAESGASIPTTYTGNGLGALFPLGLSTKARFVVTIVTASSSMTAFTIKLQGYDVSPAAGPCDFVSTRDDNGTTELEHAFACSGTGTATFSFYGDLRGFANIRVVGKATGASASGDSVTVTCVTL
jgi:hypothetical protein